MILRRISCSLVLLSFIVSSIVGPNLAYATGVVSTLPVPGTMVNLSPAFEPLLMKGIKINPANPFEFDFIMDTGHSGLKPQDGQLKIESERLIKYFLAAMTVPEKDLWVNLSPYEKNRMIADNFGTTEMGRDMLAQDYILKQLTASLIYPEKALGKKFWDNVYSKAQAQFGTSEVPVNTFNKVWIVADKADIFEQGNVAYVVGAHLKVMLEEDYTALNKNGVAAVASNHTIASDIVRQIILPEIEKEVNQGQNFTALRQMYYSMILASWYKMTLKDAVLTQIYGNQSKVGVGVNANDPTEKDKIFERYLEAYKKGVFNYIKEGVDTATQQTAPRKYFSGGTDFAVLAKPGFMRHVPWQSGAITGNIIDVNANATPEKANDKAMTIFLNKKDEQSFALNEGEQLELRSFYGHLLAKIGYKNNKPIILEAGQGIRYKKLGDKFAFYQGYKPWIAILEYDQLRNKFVLQTSAEDIDQAMTAGADSGVTGVKEKPDMAMLMELSKDDKAKLIRKIQILKEESSVDRGRWIIPIEELDAKSTSEERHLFSTLILRPVIQTLGLTLLSRIDFKRVAYKFSEQETYHYSDDFLSTLISTQLNHILQSLTNSVNSESADKAMKVNVSRSNDEQDITVSLPPKGEKSKVTFDMGKAPMVEIQSTHNGGILYGILYQTIDGKHTFEPWAPQDILIKLNSNGTFDVSNKTDKEISIDFTSTNLMNHNITRIGGLGKTSWISYRNPDLSFSQTLNKWTSEGGMFLKRNKQYAQLKLKLKRNIVYLQINDGDWLSLNKTRDFGWFKVFPIGTLDPVVRFEFPNDVAYTGRSWDEVDYPGYKKVDLTDKAMTAGADSGVTGIKEKPDGASRSNDKAMIIKFEKGLRQSFPLNDGEQVELQSISGGLIAKVLNRNNEPELLETGEGFESGIFRNSDRSINFRFYKDHIVTGDLKYDPLTKMIDLRVYTENVDNDKAMTLLIEPRSDANLILENKERGEIRFPNKRLLVRFGYENGRLKILQKGKDINVKREKVREEHDKEDRYILTASKGNPLGVLTNYFGQSPILFTNESTGALSLASIPDKAMAAEHDFNIKNILMALDIKATPKERLIKYLDILREYYLKFPGSKGADFYEKTCRLAVSMYYMTDKDSIGQPPYQSFLNMDPNKNKDRPLRKVIDHDVEYPFYQTLIEYFGRLREREDGIPRYESAVGILSKKALWDESVWGEKVNALRTVLRLNFLPNDFHRIIKASQPPTSIAVIAMPESKYILVQHNGISEKYFIYALSKLKVGGVVDRIKRDVADGRFTKDNNFKAQITAWADRLGEAFKQDNPLVDPVKLIPVQQIDVPNNQLDVGKPEDVNNGSSQVQKNKSWLQWLKKVFTRDTAMAVAGKTITAQQINQLNVGASNKDVAMVGLSQKEIDALWDLWQGTAIPGGDIINQIDPQFNSSKDFKENKWGVLSELKTSINDKYVGLITSYPNKVLLLDRDGFNRLIKQLDPVLATALALRVSTYNKKPFSLKTNLFIDFPEGYSLNQGSLSEYVDNIRELSVEMFRTYVQANITASDIQIKKGVNSFEKGRLDDLLSKLSVEKFSIYIGQLKKNPQQTLVFINFQNDEWWIVKLNLGRNQDRAMTAKAVDQINNTSRAVKFSNSIALNLLVMEPRLLGKPNGVNLLEMPLDLKIYQTMAQLKELLQRAKIDTEPFTNARFIYAIHDRDRSIKGMAIALFNGAEKPRRVIYLDRGNDVDYPDFINDYKALMADLVANEPTVTTDDIRLKVEYAEFSQGTLRFNLASNSDEAMISADELIPGKTFIISQEEDSGESIRINQVSGQYAEVVMLNSRVDVKGWYPVAGILEILNTPIYGNKIRLFYAALFYVAQREVNVTPTNPSVDGVMASQWQRMTNNTPISTQRMDGHEVTVKVIRASGHQALVVKEAGDLEEKYVISDNVISDNGEEILSTFYVYGSLVVQKEPGTLDTVFLYVIQSDNKIRQLNYQDLEKAGVINEKSNPELEYISKGKPFKAIGNVKIYNSLLEVDTFSDTPISIEVDKLLLSLKEDVAMVVAPPKVQINEIPKFNFIDNAMTAAKGGIDLDRNKMQMKVSKDAAMGGVNVKFDQAMIQEIQQHGFDGLNFKINSIVPLNLPMLLGLQQR